MVTFSRLWVQRLISQTTFTENALFQWRHIDRRFAVEVAMILLFRLLLLRVYGIVHTSRNPRNKPSAHTSQCYRYDERMQQSANLTNELFDK